MTAKVRNRITSRPGNGSPASVESGIASAAASETAPRIPDHVISASAERGGIGSRARIFGHEQARQLRRRVDPERPRDEDGQPDATAHQIRSAAE